MPVGVGIVMSTIIAASHSQGTTAAGFFGFAAGFGLLLCAVTGFICAIRIGTEPGSTWYDLYDVRGHWRGWIKTGLWLIAIGLLGLVVVAVWP